MQSTNKTIARNTIYLYFRMMLLMGVSLYTSRVILEVLGIEDYGIYQAVGGFVLMLSFVNNALANGTSRFLTFEMGVGDMTKLSATFSTLLWAHIALGVLVFIIAETAGLWFVMHELVIPTDRMDPALIAYQFCIISCFFQMIIIPFNACIIAHEKMSVYAYVGIVDALMKLLICYLLMLGSIDKLILYSILLCLINILVFIYYVFYCRKNFLEVHTVSILDNSILRKVTAYSSWNLIASTEGALSNQGATILINMFFNPSVVSARAIANQVNMAANQFVSNFRIAANPQIVKLYAAKDYDSSKKLLKESTIISFYLMLLLSLPICFVADELLALWLHEVPNHTSIFLRLAIVTSLIQVFDTSFYTALYAKGQMKENALTSPLLGILMFPIVYILFKMGLPPVTLAWAMLVLHIIISFIQKPILLIKFVNYKIGDFVDIIIPCLKVLSISLLLPIGVYYLSYDVLLSTWIRFVVLVSVSISSVLFTVWFLGISYEMKSQIISSIKRYL